MENQNELLQVTSLEAIKQMALGEVISIPGWKSDIPFNCRVKRVSMFDLIETKQIPNSLLSAADQVFNGKQKNAKQASLNETASVFKIFAKNVLIEPSAEVLEKNKIKLTDEQMIALFNYAQRGLNALKSFRTEQPNDEDNKLVGEVQAKTE